MGVMAVMGLEGDKKEMWDKDVPEEVSCAKATFDKLRKKGYMAYKVKGKNGEKGEQINEFDPDAEMMIMSPPMVGG